MDLLQFYPTPLSLASKAWKTFKNRDFVRVLDPSAGKGDLLRGSKDFVDRYRRTRYDGIEIDAKHHPALKEADVTIVGHDFLKFGNCAAYSHIIMNPPFNRGCEHVLHAWKTLFHGEIVAIINADTIRNPFSKERQWLVNCIEMYGTVEFIKSAFVGEGVERETEVDIALVHLTKVSDANDYIGDIISEMRVDTVKDQLGSDFVREQPLVIPETEIENSVISFNAAVRAMQTAVQAEAQASYYAGRLGHTMVRDLEAENLADMRNVPDWVRTTMSERYDALKDRAWTSILKSTAVTDKLSSKAAKRLQSQFEDIKNLEFTVSNIHGFLEGLSESGWEIMVDMMCDVFDNITRYHTDNAVFYMGWKSNDRHRSCGMRVKMTRFVIPGHKAGFRSMYYESMQMLRDYDKVFAMLDGKTVPEVSLERVFDKHFDELSKGERLSSSYFDVRYYPGIGTIHFFPKNKELVDRMNRMVGQKRQWLPPQVDDVEQGFWTQFDKAEKFDSEIRKEFAERTKGRSWYGEQIRDVVNANSDRHEEAKRIMFECQAEVFDRHGIAFDHQIGYTKSLIQIEHKKAA